MSTSPSLAPNRIDGTTRNFMHLVQANARLYPSRRWRAPVRDFAAANGFAPDDMRALAAHIDHLSRTQSMFDKFRWEAIAEELRYYAHWIDSLQRQPPTPNDTAPTSAAIAPPEPPAPPALQEASAPQPAPVRITPEQFERVAFAYFGEMADRQTNRTAQLFGYAIRAAASPVIVQHWNKAAQSERLMAPVSEDPEPDAQP
jgi:hypothetical protein